MEGQGDNEEEVVAEEADLGEEDFEESARNLKLGNIDEKEFQRILDEQLDGAKELLAERLRGRSLNKLKKAKMKLEARQEERVHEYQQLLVGIQEAIIRTNGYDYEKDDSQESHLGYSYPNLPPHLVTALNNDRRYLLIQIKKLEKFVELIDAKIAKLNH